VSDGVLLVDKPAGPTSFAVVARIRAALDRRVKVGHAGTLDPFATGLLLVLVGRATRLQAHLMGLPKRYRAEVVLGVRSDTGDRDGTLVAGDAPAPSPAELETLLERFRGTIDQVPPATSALKVAGRRAYALARAGEEFELASRRVTIHALEVLAYDQATGRATVDIGCSRGTYVRALARDLGEAAGCGAYCDVLRRTAIGGFVIDAAGLPDDVAADPEAAPWFRPPAEAVGHLPERRLSADESEAVRHGRALPAHGETGPTRCLDEDRRLLALAEPRDGLLRPTLVLA
jgi:tRNA pseudouridine55 synthase